MVERSSNSNSNDAIHLVRLPDGTAHHLSMNIVKRSTTLKDMIASTHISNEFRLTAPPWLLERWLECLQLLAITPRRDPAAYFNTAGTEDLIQYLQVCVFHSAYYSVLIWKV